VTALPTTDDSTTGELPVVVPGPVPRRQLVLPAATGFGLTAVPSLMLVGAAAADPLVGILAVIAVQVSLVLAWFAGVRPPGRDGLATVALAAAVGSDLLVHLVGHGRLTPVTGVVAVAFVACLVAQLARGIHRTHVTEALGSGMSLTILACTFAAAVAVRDRAGGATVLVFGLIATLLAVTAALATDLVVPRPAQGSEIRHGIGVAVAGVAAGVWGALGPAVPGVSRTGEIAVAVLTGLAAVLVAIGLAYLVAGRPTEPGAHAAGHSWGPALARRALGPLVSVAVGVASAYLLGLVVLT
jgi:hypothetical protein